MKNENHQNCIYQKLYEPDFSLKQMGFLAKFFSFYIMENSKHYGTSHTRDPEGAIFIPRGKKKRPNKISIYIFFVRKILYYRANLTKNG